MSNERETPRLAIVGAGVMGVGLATLAVGYGLPVAVVDVDPGALQRIPAEVAGQLRLARLMGALPRAVTAGELRTATSLDAVAGATAVIEAVTELPELKAKVLAEVSAAAPDALLVSNTSAIPIDELADSTPRPQQLVGIHFMNPPYLIRMVEVIRGPRTGNDAMATTHALLTALDREWVQVGDGPGFVINRILQRMINEAARVVEEGRATPDAVDALLKGCLGHRTGPLATADLIGLDNVVDSLRVLHERTGDAGYRPCDLLVAKVQAGEHGRKTGHGFFAHREALT